MTAREVIKDVVEKTDVALRGTFGKSASFLRFFSGKSVTIENEVTNLSQCYTYDPFPLVAMFTEGVVESETAYFSEFTIPKIAIVIRTIDGTDEVQKMDNTFKKVLHPIFEEFRRQLISVHSGYKLTVMHSDIASFNDRQGTASLNQICDAVIIRNLKLKVSNKENC